MSRSDSPCYCAEPRSDSPCYCAEHESGGSFRLAPDDNSKFLEAFWCRVSQLTTRTRNDDGVWVGSAEAKEWNDVNKQSCSRCRRGRTWRACCVEDDQLTCLPCRNSKMGCDRKTKFIFEYTKEQFFSNMEDFMRVYGKKEQADCRLYRKWASRKLREATPYGQYRYHHLTLKS
ncbi:hypothetical protein R3P38DRAFT_2773732 [Favolaschia claudopus]|uniref:Zn(2)-C6 fungal-type domain-containing protein n=1 Tax=Favolaschia claudopus TaxID=2862362 RepID=A0AAW0C289_9AGAR